MKREKAEVILEITWTYDVIVKITFFHC